MDKKKHAYLIMAHNNTKQLKLLIELFDHKRNDIFIHWDKKANALDKPWLTENIKHSNVYYTPRMSVTWAGYSQIECQLQLYECAVSKDTYQYYHAMTGVDLPLKTQDEIHAFFDKDPSVEYLHLAEHKPEFDDRIRYYYLFQEVYGRNHRSIYPGGLFVFDMVSLAIQRLFKMNRLRKMPFKIYKGANGCSLTHDFIMYVLSNRKWIEKRCKYSRYGDEIYLQTLAFNSHFGEKVYTAFDEVPEDMALRKIDWDRGLPYTYTAEDYDMLMNSQCLFARKFSEELDFTIIEHIVETVRSRQAQSQIQKG